MSPSGEVYAGGQEGPISDNRPEGRDIYLFGVDPISNKGYIKKSEAGIDIDDPSTRIVESIGFITVALLDHAESFELEVKTDVSPQPRRVRFTYLEG